MDKEEKEKKKKEVYKKIKTFETKGAFGQITLTRAQSTNELYICKTIDMSLMDDKEKKDAKNEAKVHKMILHPNIIKLVDTYTTTKGKLVMVLEYAENKDL